MFGVSTYFKRSKFTGKLNPSRNQTLTSGKPNDVNQKIHWTGKEAGGNTWIDEQEMGKQGNAKSKIHTDNNTLVEFHPPKPNFVEPIKCFNDHESRPKALE